ncbi:tyrosine-type recombinase/integrase [Bacillus sp. FJAT-49705]|uniref:Tyrosine-type recombinase/integrase n=1 Tax=Cytobacillus citreus TaxID=2833586 RepID=A0ABS5NTS2_9BACI|nr:tyrosine-type recombinase/integrase [Cytobacillus citreus]MBS4191218.1 tyrosine-type recombinase/integrase [Cytobacillus citreus]
MSEILLQIDSFMLYCDSKHLSKKTLSSYEQTLKLFALYLKDEFKIEDAVKVKSSHIRHYIKYLRERGKYTVVVKQKSKEVNHPDHRHDFNKQISDTTIANYLRNIKVFFNFLFSEREIKVNPVENIENIKPKRKKKSLLTPEELKMVLDTFDLTQFHSYRSWIQTRLILDTGIRAGECCDLLPENIDFKNKSILIENPKNNQERFVYFGFKMSNDLKRWMQYRDRYSDSHYLFPTIRGTKLDVRNFERTLRLAGEKVGVNIHPHLLRNNFAKYYLIEGNGDFATLSRLLGHSSVDVTMKAYLDFTDQEVARKYQKHSPLNNLDI